jgi:anti-anti-sigma factor
MPKSFTTLIEEKNNALWITLPNSIDMDNYRKIEDSIAPELSKSRRKIVLDFSRTKSLFSSGLGLVVRLKKKVEQTGGELFLVNVNKKIEEGFENVGLDKLFPILSPEQLTERLKH